MRTRHIWSPFFKGIWHNSFGLFGGYPSAPRSVVLVRAFVHCGTVEEMSAR